MKRLKKIYDLHKFFVNQSGEYLHENPMVWKTKEYYIPVRGSYTYWHYPLSLKSKLYFPIAYIKFMMSSIRD